MIVVTGMIRFAPEKMTRARPVIQRVVEATRKESGCQLYAFGEDVIEPGLMRIVEHWSDWDALARHGQSAHVGEWRAALKEIGTLAREVTAFEAGTSKSL